MWEAGLAATSSGVPAATRSPPAAPPSGPRSIMWSALLITSILCSMMMTVWPWEIRRLNESISRFMSWKWRPVVGSSKMNRVGSAFSMARK